MTNVFPITNYSGEQVNPSSRIVEEVGKDRIHLTENDEIVKTDPRTAEISNIFLIMLYRISRYQRKKQTMILL